MGKKHRKNSQPFDRDHDSRVPTGSALLDSDAIPLRLPALLTCVVLAALYAWMLSWGNGYLYTFYTTHVHDNFRVIGAFIELLTSLRLDAVKSGAPDIAWTLAIFASAFALGRLAVDSLRIELGDWGRGLKALALGLGLLSVSLLILGLVGLWTKPVMMTLVLVLLATGLIRHSSEFLAWLKTRNVAPGTRK